MKQLALLVVMDEVKVEVEVNLEVEVKVEVEAEMILWRLAPARGCSNLVSVLELVSWF